jgi:NitT/TauT family transport system permease protein
VSGAQESVEAGEVVEAAEPEEPVESVGAQERQEPEERQGSEESEALEEASQDAETAAPDALEDVEAGLDALETSAERETSWLATVFRAAYPPLLAVLLIIAVWQVLYVAKIWPDWKLPGPSEVFTSLKAAFSSGDAWPSVGHSAEHGAIGFGASVAIGTPLGLLVGRFRLIRAGVGPILSGLQSLPSVAWVPPALMFFGPEPAMLYGVVLLGAVPSIAVGVVSGLDQVPPLYLRVGRNLGARGLASVRYVLLPAALPGYLAGLRQGWAFAWRSLLAAEIIVQSADLGHSLGFLLKNAQDSNDMAGAFAAIVLILAVGVAVNQLLFVPLERRVLRSRGLA